MGQEIQLKLNNNNVSPVVEKVGDGSLQGFTATDLTGAANELKNTLNAVEDAIAYVQNGDTASRTYTAGQFVYLKNHATLAEGLYTVNSGGIPSGTTVTGHLTEDASGGLNVLNVLNESKASTESVIVPTNGSTTLPLTGAERFGIAFNASGDAARMGMWTIYLSSASAAQVKEIMSSTALSATATSGVGVIFSNSAYSDQQLHIIWSK